MTLAAASGNVAGSWADSAEKMHQRGELNDEGLHRITLLDAYGAQIANADRHHYSAALFPTQSGYDVAPASSRVDYVEVSA
jgi:hypothetical protein